MPASRQRQHHRHFHPSRSVSIICKLVIMFSSIVIDPSLIVTLIVVVLYDFIFRILALKIINYDIFCVDGTMRMASSTYPKALRW